MRKIIIFLFAFFIYGVSAADDLPQRPQPPTLVTDIANVFSDSEQSSLEKKLVDFFASTSTQIAVVSVNDLGGNDISDYAFRLGEKWGIGSDEFNNGILILIKPKQNGSDGQIFIAVGYGLEGAVPDIAANRIVEQEMIPSFRRGDYYAGADKAVSVLFDLTRGEYTAKQYVEKGKGGFNPFILFIVIFFVFPVLFGRRRRNIYSTGGRSSLPFWLAMGLMGSSHRGHSGAFNNFSSGSGSFGGGSSFGSFGGFGGGSFGGGGAGGSW
ncbi:MAG: TPM domain-containing protein [Prolixibacteraceae bacterium]|jgi:uncharacterized protein|nr:TPM domain-containing protein [Prolixibacteraceae bacterium]